LNIPETPEEAASMLQRVYRSRLAKRRCVELTKLVYEKVFDQDSDAYYYFNSLTGEAQWHKPKILEGGDHDAAVVVPSVISSDRSSIEPDDDEEGRLSPDVD
jgi:hypothetical protein